MLTVLCYSAYSALNVGVKLTVNSFPTERQESQVQAVYLPLR